MPGSIVLARAGGIGRIRGPESRVVMSDVSSLEEIGEWLAGHRSFVLLSHVRPDGDAIGSQIALGFSLEAMGKEVRLINEDGLPGNLAFLAGSERIETPPAEPVEAEVVIALDTATRDRLGERSLAAVAGCGRWINIDHHKSNSGYGDRRLIEAGGPSTAFLVYRIIRSLGMPLTAESRDAIYVGTSTDTGSFQYPATTADVHEMVADLIREGLDVGRVNNFIYHNHPLRRVELLRSLLNTLEIGAGGRLGDWRLTRATSERLGLRPEDSEGLIDVVRGIDHVVVAVFFEELADGRIRISMRSKDRRVDVSEICAQFGGGGHALAAGIRMTGPLESAREKVLAAIESSLEQVPT